MIARLSLSCVALLAALGIYIAVVVVLTMVIMALAPPLTR